ncbi:MAG: hypothetical protein LBJ17_07660 [Dysgonamonadaceae bacterium]|nr:hypothetical protein [Dysgonamonadaceae bacterium]
MLPCSSLNLNYCLYGYNIINVLLPRIRPYWHLFIARIGISSSPVLVSLHRPYASLSYARTSDPRPLGHPSAVRTPFHQGRFSAVAGAWCVLFPSALRRRRPTYARTPVGHPQGAPLRTFPSSCLNVARRCTSTSPACRVTGRTERPRKRESAPDEKTYGHAGASLVGARLLLARAGDTLKLI